jgi:hypothetical protein
MATISFNATSTGLNRTRSKTLSGADANRIIAAARVRFNMPSPTFSVEQVVDAVGDLVLVQVAQIADNWDKEAAAKAAADAVVPVALT